VIRCHGTSFEVLALAAGRNTELLKLQIDEFRPQIVAVDSESTAAQLRVALSPSANVTILCGQEGYREVATFKRADMVISAMSGSAGLLPTLDAIDAGKDIALANKEAMVMAGNIVMEKSRGRGVKILPVDSEHSAIFQCLAGRAPAEVKRLILTASGGPFLSATKDELAAAKPVHALKHPNWAMGKKITIDSASMMNKGLEVIEAQWLFNIDACRIDVLVHPQSIVHSLVEFIDGSLMAQLSIPDMRLPISYALFYPERVGNTLSGLDLRKIGTLNFMEPPMDKFPCLALAYKAAAVGGTMPAVLNAANEVAVDAFLKETIGFMDIAVIVEKVLSLHLPVEVPVLSHILAADRWAREETMRITESLPNRASLN
jgi:1-deoxy-D-xylulose-5-phosphate reductoisomerase